MSTNQIIFKNNRPEIHIDNKMVPPILYGLSDIPASAARSAQAERNIKNFSEVGINLVNADSEIRLGWHKVTPFDSEAIREEIAAVLNANPNAKVSLRLHLNPPYWWMRDNPQECAVYRNGKGDFDGIDDGESDRLIRYDAAYHMRVSLASELWLKEAGEKLKLFLDDIKETPIGDALIAIQVACGMYGEWHQWGTDVSEPMKQRFRRYLREKYITEENLRNAWHNDNVSFDTAEFHPEVFRAPDDGAFRDPQKSQDTIDAQRTIQLVVAEAILHFCRIIKENTPNILCGAFYAYYFNTAWGGRMVIHGHLYPEMIYDAKGIVDFICGPFAYSENRKLEGVPMQRGMLESSRLNGMLWLTEMDQFPFGTENFVGGDINKLPETVSMLRRNTLQPLLAGQGFWYYDHRVIPRFCQDNPTACSIYRKNGWWERPELMREINNIQLFAKKLLSKKYQPVADVLLVYDTDSLYYRALLEDQEYLMHKNIISLGYAFDSIYSMDLEKCDIDRYKCVIFVNCHKVSAEDREVFRRVTKDKLCIHMCGNGYCDGESLSEHNISSTVGINMRKISSSEIPIYLQDDEKLEMLKEFSPYFEICDTDATPLGYYNSGEVAAAIKNNDVYVPLPYLPVQLAGTLLKKSGAHKWCDSGEAFFAGGGYVTIHCQKTGKRILSLPNGKMVNIENDVCETAVIDIETGERIL